MKELHIVNELGNFFNCRQYTRLLVTAAYFIHHKLYMKAKNFDIRSEAPRSDSGEKCGILEPQ